MRSCCHEIVLWTSPTGLCCIVRVFIRNSHSEFLLIYNKPVFILQKPVSQLIVYIAYEYGFALVKLTTGSFPTSFGLA